MSDRIMVMCENRSVTTMNISEATEEKIMALATGTETYHIPERQPL
jgi:ABC-type sugar transport system ATPase subunit